MLNNKTYFQIGLGGMLLLVLFGLTMAQAGPTIVRDTRAQDTGTTPVLGRGYSISTNTFQSACLAEVVVTEPSYDFQYIFEEAEETLQKSSSVEGSAGGSYSSWWISGQLSATNQTATKNNKSSHTIVVTLNMDTYYASVNESSTPLSDAAAALLEREDVPGFFAACGPYYVRGINRNSQFISLFTYTTESDSRDTEFEASLKAELLGFLGSSGNSASANVSTSRSFTEKATEMGLTIISRGWGLGKRDDASLISSDLASFKKAITQAFISMQNPLTGKVVSVEVVPWVENAEFQRKLNINGPGNNGDKTVPLYEKKDILTLNGEFLTEMNRAVRARLDRVYRAKMCRDMLVKKYTFDGKNIIDDYVDENLRNHRLGPKDPQPIKLDELLKQVGPDSVDEIWEDYQNFAFGLDSNGEVVNSTSADACVVDLMKNPDPSVSEEKGAGSGIFLARYYEHETCRELQKRFVPPARPVIEDYCMPQLVNEL